MMPRKMRTMREISDTYYRNEDGDYIKADRIAGGWMWFIEIDGKAEGYWANKEGAFKAFAEAVEKRA